MLTVYYVCLVLPWVFWFDYVLKGQRKLTLIALGLWILRLGKWISGFCPLLPDWRVRFLRQMFEEIEIENYSKTEMKYFWAIENDFLVGTS